MQFCILQLIHEGHLGIQKCKARARLCIYRPNINDDIEKTVKSCSVCNRHGNSNQKEPMILHQLPDRPWEEVTLHTQDYLFIVDYFSKYPEVIPMATKAAEATIKAMKGIFARHGIPNKLIGDNMPFNSKKFHQFSKQWSFEVTTSTCSPVVLFILNLTDLLNTMYRQWRNYWGRQRRVEMMKH